MAIKESAVGQIRFINDFHPEKAPKKEEHHVNYTKRNSGRHEIEKAKAERKVKPTRWRFRGFVLNNK